MSDTLRNPRWEAFARAYAGDCWGNAGRAYVAAGYSENGAGQAGHRLLKNVEIGERIKALREERYRMMAVDRAWILAERLKIAADPDAGRADRLKALEHIERSIGAAEPERVKVEHSGATEHRHTVEVTADGWESLRQYIAEIAGTVSGEGAPP